MIWRDRVIIFDPKLVMRMTKLRQKKVGEILSPSEPISRAKIRPWSRQIKIMFYVIYPDILGNFENFVQFWKMLKILGSFGFFWKISSYNFHSRRQIVTARGVYWNIILHIWNGFYTWSNLKISFLSLLVIVSYIDILQLLRPLTASY